MELEFKDYEEAWIKRFIELNKRKPNRLERISWRVGFDAGCHFKEQDVYDFT